MIEDKLFWNKVIKQDSGCWEWQGGTNGNGYGVVRRRKIFNDLVRVHRYSWYLDRGYMPESDLCVCHKCDNRLCVNPDHLFIGTHKDNMRDKINKGRDRYSEQYRENNNNSKLTEEDVKEIRRLIKEGFNNTEIGKMFGVTHSNISSIRRNKTWVGC